MGCVDFYLVLLIFLRVLYLSEILNRQTNFFSIFDLLTILFWTLNTLLTILSEHHTLFLCTIYLLGYCHIICFFLDSLSHCMFLLLVVCHIISLVILFWYLLRKNYHFYVSNCKQMFNSWSNHCLYQLYPCRSLSVFTNLHKLELRSGF